MPTFYENKCAYCGKEYRGRGKIYCSNQCASKIESKKKAEKISISMKGKATRKGIPQPKAWRIWQSNRLLKEGSPMKRAEVKAKITGKNNPSWKGGVTPIHKLIRECAEYENWRKEVFKRDNFTCCFCRKRGGYLEADHIKPFALYEELRFSVDNGRTLCRECHRKGDTYRGKIKMPSLRV